MTKMADVLTKLLSNSSDWYDLWDTPFVFLGVESCNADECHSFSQDIVLKLSIKSKFDTLFNFYSGTVLWEIYMNSILDILVAARGNYSEIKNKQQRKAVETLIDFMKDLKEGGKHFKCISLLKSAAKISEAQIQAVLASHLFLPLLTEGEVVIDNKCYKNSGTSENSTLKAECPFCKDSLKEDNTNFGVQDLWHGRADIVIKTKDIQEVVTVTVDENEEDEIGGGDSNPAKKPRIDYDEWFCFAEVKTVFDGHLNSLIDERTYKQAISQTLLNAFLAVKKNKDLENTLIPSFLVSQSTVFINFYNVEQDILLVQSKPLKFMEGAVNYYAFFSVFMALNFQFFPYKRPSQFPFSLPEKSGFKTLIEKAGVLERYKNEIADQINFPRKTDSQMTRFSVPLKLRNQILSHLNDLSHSSCSCDK